MAQGRFKPRPLALDMMASGPGRRGFKTDAELVLEAKERLIEWLRDPYILEALGEIKRERPELLNVFAGRPAQRGVRAGKYQRQPLPMRPRGRPPKNRKQLECIAEVVTEVVRCSKAADLAKAVRLIVDREYPNRNRVGRDKFAKELLQAIYYTKRRLK